MPIPHRLGVIAAGAVAAVALAGCTQGSESGPTVTVTVPPSPAASSRGSSSVTPSTTVTVPATLTRLPGTCDSLLSDYTVSQALGGAQFAGNDAFVVGVADAKIGRLAAINCRYGVTGSGAAAKAKLEIGISLYGTAAQATTRVDGTATDYTSHGASSASVPMSVKGSQAVRTGNYLTGGSGSGYDLPLLVVADGQRTVAVTVDPSSITSPPAQQAAVALAELALQRTAS